MDTSGVVKEEDANIEVAASKEEVKEYVFLDKEGKAFMQEVKTGVQDNIYIEIKSGLEEGQEVLTGPYRAISKRLKNDDPINVVDKKELYTEEEK